jgi:hypothetical protein
MQHDPTRFTHQRIAPWPALATPIRIASAACVVLSIRVASQSAEAQLHPDPDPDAQAVPDPPLGVT